MTIVKMFELLLLPNDVIGVIVRQEVLSVKDLVSLEMTCRRLLELSRSSGSVMWDAVGGEEWGRRKCQSEAVGPSEECSVVYRPVGTASMRGRRPRNRNTTAASTPIGVGSGVQF